MTFFPILSPITDPRMTLCLLAQDSLELLCNLQAEGSFPLVILFGTRYLILTFHIQQITISIQLCTSCSLHVPFKTWLFGCLSCFPITVAKHQEQGNLLKKVFNLVHGFQRARIRHSRAKVWQHKQLIYEPTTCSTSSRKRGHMENGTGLLIPVYLPSMTHL